MHDSNRTVRAQLVALHIVMSQAYDERVSARVATMQRRAVFFAQSTLHRSLETSRYSECRLNNLGAAAQNPVVLSLSRSTNWTPTAVRSNGSSIRVRLAKTTKLMERI
jgi:hypothetical protein